MKRAIVTVTKTLLETILFPEGTKVIELIPEDRRYNVRDGVEIIVEHEDFIDTAEGSLYPMVTVVAKDSKIKCWGTD